MKTAWSEFLDWTNARRAADQAADEANIARKKSDDLEVRITALLQQRGPILHDAHVYWLRNGVIVCEPCTDSFHLKLEDNA